MQLRTLTRLSAVLAIVFGLAGGVFAIVGAGALEQERIALDSAGETVVDFGPIIGNNPGANVDASTTIDSTVCSGAGCDVIPVTITTPPTAEEGEFFVTVTLEWDTQELQNVPLFGEYSVNDLDFYVQNDPIVDGAGPDEDGFAYKSAGTSQPEQINMFAPTGDFNFFVVNATGVNTGYRLRFKVITDDIPDGIFESLPPAFSGGAIPPPRPPTTTPPSFATPGPAPVDLTPAVPPRADTSFELGGDGLTLEDQLASPQIEEFQPASASAPDAPSSIAILLWMLALPLALLALGGAFLLRRQRALIPI